MLAAAILLWTLAQGDAGLTNVLPDLSVQIDDKAVDLGPVYGEGDAYFVDAAKLTAAVSDGRGEFRVTSAGESILVDGKNRVTFRNEPFKGALAVCRAVGYSSPLSIKLDSAPVQDSKGRWDLDLADVDRLFGMRAEIDTLTIRLTTPEYWAGQIGIDASAYAGLNARSVGAGLVFGITPPASDMVVWCRTPGKGFAQMYKFGASPALAMAGIDHGLQIDQPSNPAYLRNISCGPDKTFRVATHWVQTEGSSETQYGDYACIVIPKSDPRGASDDALDIAKSGTDHNWLLIGGRQKRLDSPLQFALEPCKAPLLEIARRNFMDINLLRELNGLTPNEVPGPHDKVLVLSKVEKMDIPEIPSRLYEVKKGDKVRDLAATWQITPEQFFAMNSDILAGQSLLEGQIINAPISAAVTGPAAVETDFTGKARGTAPIYLSSSLTGQRIGQFVTGEPVVVTHEVEPNAYRVVYRDREGYVNRNAVIRDAAGPSPGPTGEPNLQAAITQEALKHLGTRYVWGGNNLTSGIDCSHFVAAVLTRAKMPGVPSPPVIHQETQGDMKHHKIGPYLVGPSPRTYEFTNQVPVTELHPGDRIIIQWAPLNNRAGGRHTGIFIGSYKGMKYAVVHASSSKGVTVTNLLNSWLWKGYRYAMRDKALE